MIAVLFGFPINAQVKVGNEQNEMNIMVQFLYMTIGPHFSVPRFLCYDFKMTLF